jgi:hypothetical protein
MRHSKYVKGAVTLLLSLSGVLALLACSKEPAVDATTPSEKAMENGKSANEGLRRCQRYVMGWLALADPKSGLIPRNLQDRYWNAKDTAADNYPFLVLSMSFTDRPLFESRMREMLAAEIQLTSRVGRLPDTYDFAKGAFLKEKPDLPAILFGASEYVKDGLLPITEWLGPSPWRDRMIGLLDDIWKYAPIETPVGKIVSDNVEVNGVMLQVLPRVYWMTGEEKYLDRAVRLGDYYLLGNHHPTRDTASLRLRDHGNEVVSGLCELYATVHFARPEKERAYREPIHAMLDRILEVGRNKDGLFYDAVNPQTGAVAKKRLADNWGYILNGFYTVYLVDGTQAYRQATLKVLASLARKYRGYRWEGERADGYADAIEGALYLYNRERVASTAAWMDSEIRVLWGKQKQDGTIEGYHCDGNFARTTLMYCLWKTGGVSIRPWREDVVFGSVDLTGGVKSEGGVDSAGGVKSKSGVKSEGGVDSAGGLLIAIRAEKDWQGTLLFDAPRHKTIMKLPLDWPRINQFPEWFTVAPEGRYSIRDAATGGAERVYSGGDLHAGIPLTLRAGEEKHIEIQRHPQR